MANVARLGVVLGMDSAEFVKGLDNAKKQLFNFQNGLKAGAFAAFTTQLVNWADKLADTADAFDLTIGSVVKLRGALQQSGGTADDAGKLLGKLATSLDNAANAGKEAQASFKNIGVSLDDISKLSQEDLLSKTIANIAKIDDPVRRNAAAVDIFGKAIRGVDIKKLNEELQKTTHITKEQEDGIKDAANAADIFAGAWDKLNRVTAEYLGPLAKGIAQVFEDIVDGVDRAIRALEALGTAFKNLIESIPRLPSTGAGDQYDDAISGAIDTATGGYTRKGSQTPSPLSPTTGVPRKVTPYVDKGDLNKQNQLLKELKVIEQISDSYQAQLKLQEESIQLQTAKLGMTQNQAQIAQLEYDIEKRRTEQIAQLEDKIAVARETKADQKVIDALQAQIDKVNELTNAYKQQIVEAEIANQNATQSFLGGWQEAFQKYQLMAIDNAAIVTESINGLFNGLTNGLTAFVTTGKLQFADFARAIIADLIRIQIQAIAAKIFGAALGAITGAYTPGLSADPAFAGPPAPRAEGGPVDAGMPYLVGERGPELIVPNRSGTVIPNSSLGQMGGTTNITNNYINAIDTKSFEDRLYQSSNAVWSANQYANKNISNSRTRS